MPFKKSDNLVLLEFKAATSFHSISFISTLFSFKARLFA